VNESKMITMEDQSIGKLRNEGSDWKNSRDTLSFMKE
jgi:hypothetical protein